MRPFLSNVPNALLACLLLGGCFDTSDPVPTEEPAERPPVEAKLTAATPPAATPGATETVPGDLVGNGGFEAGEEARAEHWFATASAPPRRSRDAAHSGSFGIHSTLANEGATPREGLLTQTSYGVVEGATYGLSFFAKQVSFGVSYVQEYSLTWLDEFDNELPGSRKLTSYQGGDGTWKHVTVDGLVAPPEAKGVRIVFRFVTGAVDGGSGEVHVDDVKLTRVVGASG